MRNHPTYIPDQEDQRRGRKEGRAQTRLPWYMIGFASALGALAALVNAGVI